MISNRAWWPPWCVWGGQTGLARQCPELALSSLFTLFILRHLGLWSQLSYESARCPQNFSSPGPQSPLLNACCRAVSHCLEILNEGCERAFGASPSYPGGMGATSERYHNHQSTQGLTRTSLPYHSGPRRLSHFPAPSKGPCRQGLGEMWPE